MSAVAVDGPAAYADEDALVFQVDVRDRELV
jgi:hypothetical protein